MSLPRALLISTLVVICVIETVAHVLCCSSPAKASFNASVFNSVNNDGSSSQPDSLIHLSPGSSGHASLAPALKVEQLAQNPAPVLRWKALLKEASKDILKEVQEEAITPAAYRPGLTKKQAAETSSVKWVSPHYETWNPPTVYGPPLPPERTRVQQQAHRLLQDLRAGRLSVLYDARDGDQLRCLERDGLYAWPAPPSGVSLRHPRQRAALEGTAEGEPSTPDDKRLASRSSLPQRFPTANPADDPEFDPCNNPPAPGLLRLLTTLASHSTSTQPLTLLSLLRPPYRFGDYVHVGPTNPHSLGLAVDIAAYGGHNFRQSEPEECVAAAISLLHDLPPGRYRLGMPKAPENVTALPPYLTAYLGRSTIKSDTPFLSSGTSETVLEEIPGALEETNEASNGKKTLNKDLSNEKIKAETKGCLVAALYGLHAGSACLSWPFFPAPFTEMISAEVTGISDDSETATPAASFVAKAPSRPVIKRVLRFQNESYAAECDLNDARLREALAAARKRGADVIALFPDGLDHLHIDVRQNP